MRDLHCGLIFAVIMSTLVIFLAGCAIGVRPRSYDVPAEDDAYYEEPVYGPYYGVGTGQSDYYRDPSYDPWTMSTYYQYYSGPPRTDRSSDSQTAGGTESENKRPAVKSRNSTSVHQSRAPSSERVSSTKERTGTQRSKNTSSESGRSPINRQKVRTNTRRGTTQTVQEEQQADESHTEATRTTSQKARKPPKSESEDKEEEEKKKSHN
jgi:hypothetical protein